MGYVGNEPSVNFTSFAKQDLTGVTGSPAKRGYTLSHAVANANEIEVFVNNVRQEPTEAYTVSGTGLTMTGDVETSDDFYIIFLGKAIQTTVPPDGSVTSAKLDTNLVLGGFLTQTNKPRFHARRTDSAQSASDNSNTDAIFNTEDFDVNGTYNTSNGTYTVTQAGTYFIYTGITITRDDTDIVDAHIGILVNGSVVANTGERYASNYIGQTHLSLSRLISLSASDVVKVRVYANSLSNNNINIVSHHPQGLNTNSDFDTHGFASHFGGYMI